MSDNIIDTLDSPKVIKDFLGNSLLPYQIRAVEELYQGIITNTPKLLLAPTRTGKTYALAAALKKAQDAGYLKSAGKMTNILFLTTKSVKTQTVRVFSKWGITNFQVENYATLRASLGGLFITWKKGLEYGSLVEKPEWIVTERPDIIICDECQMVKNSTTLQAQIIRAAAEAGILIIFASATPFVTIADAEVLSIGLRVTDKFNWQEFSTAMCATGADVREASPKSAENLKNFFEKHNRIVRFKDIKYRHRVFNKCVLITFKSQAKWEYYLQTWNDYVEECRKLDKSTPEGVRKLWVLMQKQFMRAEDIRKEELADYGVGVLKEKNNQIIIGANYLGTLRGVWNHLVKVHKISPAKIGYIIGDQTEKERQQHIDRFQYGLYDFCLLTLKSGGAGISLHHENKKARPRYCIIPPCWSPIQLTQVLGRAHGPTSLSTTRQDVLWLKGTVEERVAEKVSKGISCLGELVNKKESWVDLFSNLTEEEASKVKALAEDEAVDKDKESGEEIIFSAEALEDNSVE